MPYVTERNITDIVLDRWSAVPDPRLRQIMQSMIRHLHAFVRDVEPTEQEWMTAIEWLTRTGQLSTDKRQEFILASDIVGVSMLVDCINHRLSGGATPTTVTGPFHAHDSPDLADGADIANGAPGELCYVVGSVHGLAGQPIAGATLDIWQADGDGLYDAQHGGDEPWMRGIFKSGANGSFVVQTVLPGALLHPDGRQCRRVDEANRDQPDAAIAHSFSDRCARPPPGHHPSVQKVLSLHRNRCGLRCEGAVDRRISAASRRQHDADRACIQSAILAVGI